MGHLVNANFFRLGRKKKWISSYVEQSSLYKQYLQEDLIIFRFINLFFKEYSVPNFPNTNTRTKRGEKNNKISGLDNLIKNQFINYSFVFF